MALSSREFDQIRRIIREELRSALSTRPNSSEASVHDEPSDPEIERHVQEMLAKMRAPPKPIPPDRYLGTYDAARLVDVMPTTINNWVRTGKLTRHGRKNKLLVDREELAELAAKRSRR